jgi:hypothetical protein
MGVFQGQDTIVGDVAGSYDMGDSEAACLRALWARLRSAMLGVMPAIEEPSAVHRVAWVGTGAERTGEERGGAHRGVGVGIGCCRQCS